MNKNKDKIVIINFLLIFAVFASLIQTDASLIKNTIEDDTKVDPSLDMGTLMKKFDVNEFNPNRQDRLSLNSVPETVIGTDGRVRITPTTVWPYSAVCKIRAWYGLIFKEGSGAVISKNHALTAAHVVYDAALGGWPTAIEVIPAQDNGFGPYGVAMTTYVRIYPAWAQSEDPEHDFALLTLNMDIGLTTGALALQTAEASNSIYTGELHTAGYPADKDFALNMWYSNENGYSATNYKHYYYLDTYGGQSGSPVWYNDGYGFYILTVHAYGTLANPPIFNSGTRLNQGKINDIITWINNDLSVPIPSQPNMRDRGLIYASFSPSTVRSITSTFQVACDIQNLGIVETGAFTVSFYASADTTITTSDYLIGVTTGSSIQAKSFGRVSWSGSFPTAPTGNYYIGWIIDASNSIAELREDDNVACYTSTQILVDNDAPSNPTISTLINGSTLSNQWQNIVNNPYFNWTGASDIHSGVHGYYYYWGTSSVGTSPAYTTSVVYDPPSVNSGIYYLRVQTRDNVGNLAPWTTIYTFKYDGDYPISSLNYTIAQSPDIISMNTEFSISTDDVNGSGIYNISLRINDNSWFNYSHPFNLSGFSEGYHTIDYYATDLVGNIEPIKSEIIYLDKDPPSTIIQYTAFTPNFVNITTLFSFSDDDGTGSGINNTYYRIDGGFWSPYITSFTLFGLIEGAHTIDFYSIDYVGNAEQINSEIIYLDKDPPSTTIHYTAFSLSFVNLSTLFSFSDDDGTGSGINNTYYRIDGGFWTPYITSFTLFGLIEGAHTIDFYSIDYVGNSELINSEILYLDLNAPSTSLHYEPEILQNQVNTSTWFTLSGIDGSGSGIQSLFYRIDGGTWVIYSSAFNLTGYGNGNHTIEYYGIDNVENQEDYNIEIVFIVIPEEISAISGYSSLIFIPIIILAVLAVTVYFNKRTLKR